MLKRHSSSRKLPRLWLMTDEKMGDALLPSIAALPKGSGVIFRHYSLAPTERRALFGEVRKIARRRRLVLILAGPAKRAQAWGADGSHGRGRGCGIRTAPVHNIRERIEAERNGADLLFISPVFATTSHVGRSGLGTLRFGFIVKGAKQPVIALGGLNVDRARRLNELGIYGWAGIDGLTLRRGD
jgi:thiamine-phosphate pyrophosphorylase